jgi:hypothetical protein
MSFLRKLFGPSKQEIWQQFSATSGASYIASDGFWKGDKVEARHGEWTVTLDTYTISTGKSSVTFTRMRAPYVNPDGFRFTIYQKGIFSGLGKQLGMQDVTVGHPEFDEAFIIKGNDEPKLQRLFANHKIRELIAAQPNIRFCVVDDEHKFWGGRGFPEGVDELYFQTAGVIKDVARLKLLYELFSETLDELCRIGSAYENDPQVKL